MRCMETGVAKGFGAISPSVEKKNQKRRDSIFTWKQFNSVMLKNTNTCKFTSDITRAQQK